MSAGTFRLANSESTIQAKTDFFRVPVTDATVEDSSEQWFSPSGNLDGVLMFNVPNNAPNQFLDLRNTRLYVSAQIVKENGSPILARTEIINKETVLGDEVCPVNLLLHSMWKQVDVNIQQHPMNDVTGHYPYVAYLKALLENGYDAKTSWMESMLFTRNAGITPNTADWGISSRNRAVQKRAEWTFNKVFDMEGPLFLDVFEMPRCLPNGVPLQVKLTPSSDNFRLLCGQKDADSDQHKRFKLKVHSALLKVTFLSVSTPLYVGIENQWKKTLAKFPYWRTCVKNFIWDAKTTDNTYHNVFQGDIPNVLYMAFTRNSSYAGNMAQDPFYFEHFNVREISLSVNGRIFNNNPLKVNFTDDQGEYTYVEAFSQMQQNLKAWNRNGGNGIGRDEFRSGNTFFVFDFEKHLTKDLMVFPPMKKGSLSVRITFAPGGPVEDLTVLFIARFRSMFGISPGRQVQIAVESSDSVEEGRPAAT